MNRFLTAEWRNLAVATFETDKKILEKYLPNNTEVNDCNGKYFMSLVGFMFSNPAFFGIKVPYLKGFEEMNLRFYVKHKIKNGWRNGVVFIKEIAPSIIIGQIAKLLYHENFIALPMKHSFTITAEEQSTEYQWKINKKWNFFKLKTSISPLYTELNSIEAFIKNHYWGYTKVNSEETLEFEIKHISWNIFPSTSFELEIDAEMLYGKELASFFYQNPLCCFLMDGSSTEISRPGLL